MGRVRVRISAELFREWMPLPPTAVIDGSVNCVGDVEIIVSDPSLPDVLPIPDAVPRFRRNAQVEFVEWGI